MAQRLWVQILQLLLKSRRHLRHLASNLLLRFSNTPADSEKFFLFDAIMQRSNTMKYSTLCCEIPCLCCMYL